MELRLVIDVVTNLFVYLFTLCLRVDTRTLHILGRHFIELYPSSNLLALLPRLHAYRLARRPSF